MTEKRLYSVFNHMVEGQEYGAILVLKQEALSDCKIYNFAKTRLNINGFEFDFFGFVLRADGEVQGFRYEPVPTTDERKTRFTEIVITIS